MRLAGEPELILIGCHHDRFALRKATSDRHYLVHDSAHPAFVESLRRVIERERVDLLVPASDRDVRVCSDLRAVIPCRLLLPSPRAIALCQDKYDLAVHLRARGIKVYGATITPFNGNSYYSVNSEACRQRINTWVRTTALSSGKYDAVIDFDKIISDPQHPLRFNPKYDSGDHLHPSDAGYTAMAAGIDLKLFRK